MGLLVFALFGATTIEWWDRYMWPLKFEECEWKNLPQALCDFVIYEQGYRMTEAENAEVLRWPPPNHYTPFKEKLEWHVEHTHFKIPREWPEVPEGQPRIPPQSQLQMLMGMRPMGSVARANQLSSWEWRTQTVQPPVGQSYYEVMAVAIDENHGIAHTAGASVVIFCKEQILEWVAGGKVIGWPTASLSLHGLESRGAGPYRDPRDEMPRCDWVTLRMEEEIELRVGRMRDAASRLIQEGPEGDGNDDDDPPGGPSRLGTISESGTSPK